MSTTAAVLHRPACAGAPLHEFFPTGHAGRGHGYVRAARAAAVAYCGHCPVLAACHEFAERTGCSGGLFAGCWRPDRGAPIPLIPAAERLVPRRYR